MTKEERGLMLAQLINENEYLFYSIYVGTFSDPCVITSISNEALEGGFMKLMGAERYALLMILVKYVNKDGISKIALSHMEELTGLSYSTIRYALKLFEAFKLIEVFKVKCPTNNFMMNAYKIHKVKIIYANSNIIEDDIIVPDFNATFSDTE